MSLYIQVGKFAESMDSGTVKADKLKKYHYKILMPYFTNPVVLHEFHSFEKDITTIQNNLKA